MPIGGEFLRSCFDRFAVLDGLMITLVRLVMPDPLGFPDLLACLTSEPTDDALFSLWLLMLRDGFSLLSEINKASKK